MPPSEKTAFDEFMLSEYETIASAHFDLHSGLRQNFRFYLGLVAVPFTVLAVAFKDQTSIFVLPNVLRFLFALIPFLGLMMFLQMVHTRFDIILYTRAVNGVRAYFEMRAKEIGVNDVAQYFKLPRNKFKPHYRVAWQSLLLAILSYWLREYFISAHRLSKLFVLVLDSRPGRPILFAAHCRLLRFWVAKGKERNSRGEGMIRIGLDLDGVLSDIVGQLLLFARNDFGLEIAPESIISESVEQCTPLTREQLVQLFSSSDFFATMPKLWGARETVALLKARGASVHIVTDRFWYPEIQSDTAKWLREYDFVYDSLTFAPKAEKQTAAVRLGLHCFVEDQRSNANLLANVCNVILLNRSYNQGPLAPTVVRVPALSDAIDILLTGSSSSPTSNTPDVARAI